ncbi:serine/threonine-protein phosphatase 7 long form homolog [Gossypium arboreum]|nr:serine/threonine-protein phosphatase 7 long form homolog [Gossypium arboreum]
MGKPAILEIRGHLQAIGFLHVSRMFKGCKLDLALISTLVERWRPKTHTLHLSCDECTITLNDVVLQIGLLMDGPVITGSMIVPSKVGLCESLLGKVPDKFKSGRISINWLKDNFDELPENRTEEVIEQYARAYIMRLIGGILMSDKSQNLVHIKWQLHLMDFNECEKLSWRSVVLSILFREMCRATILSAASIGGCLLMLQAWVWWRLLFLHPKVTDLYMFPLVTRSVGQSIDVGRQCAIGSVHDGGNALIGLGVMAAWVEATNSTTIARLEGVVQGGHAGEGQ